MFLQITDEVGKEKVLKCESDQCDVSELASGRVPAALPAFLNDSWGGDKAVSLSFLPLFHTLLQARG